MTKEKTKYVTRALPPPLPPRARLESRIARMVEAAMTHGNVLVVGGEIKSFLDKHVLLPKEEYEADKKCPSCGFKDNG